MQVKHVTRESALTDSNRVAREAEADREGLAVEGGGAFVARRG